MAKSILLFSFTSVLLLCISAYSEEKWDESYDGRNIQAIQSMFSGIDNLIWEENWDAVNSQLNSMKYRMGEFERRGFVSHPRVLEVKKIFEEYKKIAETRSPIKPEEKGKVVYVSLEKGVAKKGGSKQKPAKYLWRTLSEVQAGNEIYISGHIEGQQGCGYEDLTKAYVTLKGGFSSDFANWNPTEFPTVFRRGQNSKMTSLNNCLLQVSNIANGIVLDALIFDFASHNVYERNGNINIRMSSSYPAVKLNFSKKIWIRNCVFLNAPSGGLELLGTAEGAEAIVENCLFLNCASFGLKISGISGTKFIVRNNTFSLIQMGSGGSYTDPGKAIYLATDEDSLEAMGNIFAYCDVAVFCRYKNLNFTLKDNSVHCMTKAFLSCQQKDQKVYSTVEELDELDVKGEMENNVKLDPELNLDGLSLLKYLKNIDLKGIEKDVLDKEIERLKAQGISLVEQPKTAEKPVEEKKAEDPFNFFAKKESEMAKKEAEKKANEKEAQGGTSYYLQAYPWEKVWAFPLNPGCKAGAAKPMR
ncbi:MAG: right-handed parallel beta-helix repeat-containing protein [Candidatus Brocadiae bacterium]|nr:right-handed parallel beta-helix repeat-containing protein [Candidatus Brocadiia bacterium]